MAIAAPSVEAKRVNALSREKWNKFFDSDGRLVNEFDMRKAIFEGNSLRRKLACVLSVT